MRLDWHDRDVVPAGSKAGTSFTDPMLLRLKDGSVVLGNALMAKSGNAVHSWYYYANGTLGSGKAYHENCFKGERDVVQWAWAPTAEELALALDPDVLRRPNGEPVIDTKGPVRIINPTEGTEE